MSILILCCFITTNVIYATQANDYDDNKDSIKGTWRIGYCESEHFTMYTDTLVHIIYGLEEMGWVNNLDGFEQVVETGDSKTIWNWLSSNDISPYIEFVDDAYYNLWETDEIEIVNRIKKQDDIDIMITMGALAGVKLTEFEHNTNIFVFAASNAVLSGIIESADDSGKDNVWAHMDEDRFERQLRAFYDIVEFERLGIVYEDSEIARVFSAINEIETLAKEKGFEIVEYHVDEPNRPEEFPRYYQEVAEAYNKLSEQVDAVFVTVSLLESEKLPELFQPFYDNKIPIFSQLGNIEVKHGALMTVSVMDEVNVGRFGAYNIIQCLKGAKPRELEQTFQSSPQIALNVEVANILDFKLPFELVIVVDEAYQTIGGE